MTTTTSWLAVSGAGRRTFYLGADSQGTVISGNGASNKTIKKVFASNSTPEVFAFSGDASWGSYFIKRLLDKIEKEEVVSELGTIERAREFCSLTCSRPSKNAVCELGVLYGVRAGSGRKSTFRLFELRHSGSIAENWRVKRIAEDKLALERSTRVFSSGLGGSTHVKRQEWIASGDQGDVARTSFWSLCDLVDGKPRNDIMTGGFPQLVKLDESGCGVVVGICYFGTPTVYGQKISLEQNRASVWVNQEFIQLDPRTLKPFKNAQMYGRRDDGR